MIKSKLLFVDDNVMLAEMLMEQFVLHDEFEITLVENAKQAHEILADEDFDLVLLDLNLPDQDGREACKKMRADGLLCPIVMLTGAASEADMILGLDAGANDYITKPFRFGVLLARIRAHLRQHAKTENVAIPIGQYIFRPSIKVLENGDEKIRLTEKETNILRFLFAQGDVTVARETLLHEVWGYNAQVTTHTLETHIYRLRQKIESNPSEAKLLLTEDGGYRLAR